MSIDQSLSCSGVTVWDNGELAYFTAIKTQPKTDTILRIRQIMEELTFLIRQYDVSTVVIESLPFGLNSTSVRPLASLHMCIQNLCIDLNLEFYESHVTKTKKLATGKGSAKKQDMIDALPTDVVKGFKLAGYKKTTGLADLADSYHIYKLYEKEHNEES